MDKIKYSAINNYLDKNLDKLKLASFKGDVVKGLREVIRLIKNGRAEEVYLALGDDLGNKYFDVVTKFTKSYLGKNPVIIKDFRILRDIVICKKPNELIELHQNKFNVKNKGPKCYCAAIVKSYV